MTTASRARRSCASEFGAPDRGMLKALSDRFTVRTFRFSSAPRARHAGSRPHVRRIADAPRRGAVGRAAGAGRPAGGRPRDGERRRRHRRRGARRGAARAQGRAVCRCSRSASGRETLSRDIQVGRVITPKTALKGTTLMVDVVLSQSGFDGQTVTLDVEDEGHAGQHAAGDAAGRRHAGVDSRALHGDRGRPARAALPRVAAAGRARHARTTRARR